MDCCNNIITHRLGTVSTVHEKPHNDIRPYASILISNLPACGLLDSGSAVTIIGNNYHNLLTKELGLTLQPGDKMKTFVAAGGQTLQSIGILNLPVTFEGTESKITAYVIPSIDTPILLGMDFWKAFNLLPKNINSVFLIDNSTNEMSKDNLHLHSFTQLTEAQKITAEKIKTQFQNISSTQKGLGRTSLITHSIDTGDALPIRQRYYRMSPEKQRVLSTELDEMIRLDVVEPCESPWSSPVLLTPKKDGKLRFCLDSRKLNAITKKDAYNLPYISEILDNLRDAKYLSSIDLYKSFWQLPLKESDKNKTAFYIPGRGTYRFKTTPFGLTNAPATQQRLVDGLFYGPEFENRVFAFLDDIVLVSSDYDNHIALLTKVYDKLSHANLTINMDKCKFFREELQYLGYVVNSKGLQPDPDKVDAILNFPVPTNPKEVKRFLGTASWYRRFIPNFSALAAPLNKLTSSSKKAPPFTWSQECEEAFTKLKEILITAPVLSCPDYSLPFEVHTDASNYGIGGLLTQTRDGVEHPIAYMSKSLSKQQQNYSITEREALAVLLALEHWRCYLENGIKFTVFTDHSALKWFLKLQNPTGRLARWGIRLSAFNFDIQHRRGTDNTLPDALSRACPVAALTDNTTTSMTHPQTKDNWYLNIYNGCQHNPTAYPNYIVKHNKLYRYEKNKFTIMAEFEWKEVIPTEARPLIITENHAEPMAGHLGIYKTYKRLSLRYYWPGMHGDVVKFVTACEACIAHKQTNHAPLGLMGKPKECSRPFQMLSIDIVGPLPFSRRQNSYLFVATCCFSKYCLLFPMRNANASTITRLLEDNIFLVHGVPQCVILDNGTQFTSNEMKNLFRKYNIPSVHYTPKYTPQVNTVERYNKTIVTAVATYINDDQRSWDLHIPKVQFALNSSTSEVTGYTPAFLVYGRELVADGSHYLNEDIDEIIYQPRDDYAENLGVLSTIFDQVQNALLKAYSRNTRSYNLRRKNVEFNVGDVVWKRTYYQSDKDKYFSKKLAPKYVKCKVIKKQSPIVYDLVDSQGKPLGTWHIKDLKWRNPQ